MAAVISISWGPWAEQGGFHGESIFGCSCLGGLGNGAGCRRRVWDSETKKQRIPTANSFDVWPQRAAELVRNSNIQFLGFVSNFEIKVKVQCEK